MSKDNKYKILDRYILMKYLKTFLLALLLIIIIVITFDVSEKLDDFLRNHAPIKDIIFQYYLNFIPSFVNLYSPLFIFISVIFFTSKMAGNTEIIAILGSGISYKRMLRPYLHGAVIIAVIVMILGNFVIPYSNRFLSDFEQNYVKTIHRTYYSTLHFQPKQGVQVYTESFDATNNQATFLQRDAYNDEGVLVDRVSSYRAIYDSTTGFWQCSGYSHRTITPEGETLKKKGYLTVDLKLTPEDFDLAANNIETMNTLKLTKYIEKEKMRGSGAVIEAKIEFYQRILNPLAIIVMTFIGVSISSRKTRGGIGVHLAIGISIAFAFIVFMKISTVFAINGNLPPFLAVLLPQLVFGIAAIYLIRTAPK